MRKLGATLLFLVVVAPAGAMDISGIAEAVAERQAICDRDQAALWGRSLCGPLLFVDPATREVVANQPNQALTAEGALFTGKLPEGVVIANTAMRWSDVHWAMIQLPLPQDKIGRANLLIHESWHRIQEELGLPARSPIVAHLATEAGRVAMRLEWRALAEALAARSEPERRRAIRDALVFRAARRVPQGADLENQLELNEGLAEYTGRKLSGQDAAAIVAALKAADHGEAFARSFAYASGPAYGYLLDLADVRWRPKLTAESDLGGLLKAAAHITLPKDLAKAVRKAGPRYGAASIEQEERTTAQEHDKLARSWKARLVDGPVLRLAFDQMNIQFNPSNLFPLPPYGTVYPTITVIDRWGTVSTKDGALIDDGWTGVTFPAGSGWTLKLNPGWTQQPGPRPGDVIVVKTDAPKS